MCCYTPLDFCCKSTFHPTMGLVTRLGKSFKWRNRWAFSQARRQHRRDSSQKWWMLKGHFAGCPPSFEGKTMASCKLYALTQFGNWLIYIGGFSPRSRISWGREFKKCEWGDLHEPTTNCSMFRSDLRLAATFFPAAFFFKPIQWFFFFPQKIPLNDFAPGFC